MSRPDTEEPSLLEVEPGSLISSLPIRQLLEPSLKTKPGYPTISQMREVNPREESALILKASTRGMLSRK